MNSFNSRVTNTRTDENHNFVAFVFSTLFYYSFTHLSFKSNTKVLFCLTVKPTANTIPITAAVLVLALILIGAAGFIVYKKKKGKRENGKVSVCDFVFFVVCLLLFFIHVAELK